jgi:hypothetical protein
MRASTPMICERDDRTTDDYANPINKGLDSSTDDGGDSARIGRVGP